MADGCYTVEALYQSRRQKGGQDQREAASKRAYPMQRYAGISYNNPFPGILARALARTTAIAAEDVVVDEAHTADPAVLHRSATTVI